MSSFQEVFESLRRLGAARLATIAVTLGLGIAGLWGLVAWAGAPTWVPLVSDLPVAMVGESTRALDELGVEYRLVRGGTEIHVAESEMARARVGLAQQGLPRAGRPGFELFDEATWGMTDFTQRVNYRRALEGELERTISTMQGVSAAQVLLALREGTVYRSSEQPVEASVLVSLTSGARPPAELVEAITYLMASSVDGLTTEKVSVVDDAGRVLSAAAEPSDGIQLDRRRLAMRQEQERYLADRATELVETMIGVGNVRVAVSAMLDYEESSRTTQTVDPNTVLTREVREEIEPGDPTQGAASTHFDTEFEASRSTEVVTKPSGSIQRLTVSVALNQDAISGDGPAMLGRIETLVANAVGFDPARGDEISVVASPFEPVQVTPVEPPAEPSPILQLLREFQKPLLGLIALGLTFALVLRGLKVVRSLPAPPAALPSGGQGSPALAGVEGAPGVGAGPAQGGAMAPPDGSRVVRAWLSEG